LLYKVFKWTTWKNSINIDAGSCLAYKRAKTTGNRVGFVSLRAKHRRLSGLKTQSFSIKVPAGSFIFNLASIFTLISNQPGKLRQNYFSNQL